MTDDTRQARIAAAEQAIDDAIWRLMGTRMSITGENLYQQVATAAIDAADAAAPAVGVTVEWLDARIAAERKLADPYQPHVAPGCVSVPVSALCDVLAWVEVDDDLTDELRQAVIVLGALAGDAISAQPEPGTHDAGQATEGETS